MSTTVAKVAPWLEKAEEQIRKKREAGMRGIRFLVPDNRDFSAEDLAQGFCEMENAISDGRVQSLDDVDF